MRAPKPTYTQLVNQLEGLNQKICELEQHKIMAIFNYIGLDDATYNEKECFRWDRILISVPDQDKFLELQQLEHLCSRIEFILNKHSDAYFICDYEDWRHATKGMGQQELDHILKSNFGFFSKN